MDVREAESEVSAALAGGVGGADSARLGEGISLRTRFFVSPSWCAGGWGRSSSRQVLASLEAGEGTRVCAPVPPLHLEPVGFPCPEAGRLGP